MATPESLNECRKRNILKHKIKGICRDCSAKVVPGKIRCQEHLDYQKKYWKVKKKKQNNE